MFIYNIKISNSKIFKFFIVISILLMIILFSFAIYKVIDSKDSQDETCVLSKSVSEIAPKNYTNILKAVHENIDTYIGKEIKFSGFVYRVYDFKENQFVLGRNMIISSDFQSVVVGFLCESDNIKNIEDGAWVEITGKIQKTDYHGDMPFIKIDSLKEIKKPAEEYVYPPDDTYIPTNSTI